MDPKVNDFNLFNDINLKTEEYARKAFRARPQNLWVYLHGDKTAYEVDNISISGLCFKTKTSIQDKISGGQQVRLILASSKREFLSLVAQVVRVEEDSCSCFFPNLSDEEEIFLDKFILEMQKHEILRIKLQRQKQLEIQKEKSKMLKLKLAQVNKESGHLSFDNPNKTQS